MQKWQYGYLYWAAIHLGSNSVVDVALFEESSGEVELIPCGRVLQALDAVGYRGWVAESQERYATTVNPAMAEAVRERHPDFRRADIARFWLLRRPVG